MCVYRRIGRCTYIQLQGEVIELMDGTKVLSLLNYRKYLPTYFESSLCLVFVEGFYTLIEKERERGKR